MKKIYYYLPMAAIALGAASCNGGGKEKEAAPAAKFDLAYMDTTAAPGNSFFQYATGKWDELNPMPSDKSRYGTFDLLRENNIEQIKGIIMELGETKHDVGSVGQKIGDLYAIAMDSAKLNNDGATPIKAQLEEISKAENMQDILQLVAKLRKYTTSPFFGAYVSVDMKDSDAHLVGISQGGISLGLRDYYVDKDEKSVAIREGYKTLISKQFVNAGFEEEAASKAPEVILGIETALAQNHITKEQRRDPEANYHKMTVEELKKTIPNFEWDAFFNTVFDDKKFDDVNLGQPNVVKASIAIMQKTSIEDIKTYLSWLVIDAAASTLSDNFVDANFEFYGKLLSGKPEQSPRWKRSVETVQGVLDEAVGQIYVEKYFPAEAKERMVKLVKNLQGALGERIQGLTWMSDETKAKAQQKLDAFTVKIGYPDKWKDYSSLEIKKDSYYANMKRAQEFGYNEMLDKIGKPVDKTEWHMPPQMVNAYYSPVSNEICFPAGILQPPFFYLGEDDAVNYGAIGVVIGHEMSHGFDDQGSRFAYNGNLENWWTDADSKEFKDRAQVLVDHFNKIEVLPSLFANGAYTLGENIGDFGGLQISYHAFSKTEEGQSSEKIDGFTPQQRFFLSYANVWAGSAREDEVRRLTKVDVHALSKWRVDGTLPHINAWYDAFGITESDSLYIAKERRADIW